MKAGLLLWLLLIAGHLFANFSQGYWRWRRDNGSEINADALAPQDFPYTGSFVAGVSERLRLRITVCNSLDHNETGIITLQYRCGRGGGLMKISGTVGGHDLIITRRSPLVI